MFQEVLDRINAANVDNVYLYLVVRALKPETKSNSRVTEKYDFDLRQIDIDDDIRDHLRNLTVAILEKHTKKPLEVHEYSPITDSSQRAFTYSMENNAISFSSVINAQSSGNIAKVHDFGKVVKEENLWAYCVGFYDEAKDEWTYTFKKVKPGQAVVEESDPNQNGIWSRLQTRFNSNTDKLEVLKGETFILEKSVDCFYFEKRFLIVSKSAFEEIADLKVEQEKQAQECVADLKNCGVINGIDVLEGLLEGNTTLHKKLVKLQSLGHYKTVDWAKVSTVINDLGLDIKIENNQLVITDPKDVDLVVKLLGEYYKEGRISGETYGTFAGVKIS